MHEDPLSLKSLTILIRDAVSFSPHNRLTHIDGSPIFDTPLIDVADGDDPLFERYRSLVGPHHLTPRDILARTAKQQDASTPATVRVLCWALPIAEATKRSNAVMRTEPSWRWAHTRHYGEVFNNQLRSMVERYINDRGGHAVAPATSTHFTLVREVSHAPSSNWSERHALYAAGLGTFGLCDSFITPIGKAMRCGTVVTDLPLPVTPRLHASHTAACIYLSRGGCGDCIARCPAGAISRSGHDKRACERYLEETLRPIRNAYSVTMAGCGLCQTGVPCESAFPS